MEELLKNDVVRAKIKSLSVPVKKAFIESLLDLYEQETEEMIDVIEESRMELRGDFLSFTESTDRLRAESRMLEQRRKEYDGKSVEDDIRKRDAASRNSRLSYVDEQKNQDYVHNYRKKRGTRHTAAADMTRSSSTASVQVTSSNRPISVISTRSTRSLPTPSCSRTIEEESESVMKNLTTANIKMESERMRQTELLEQRKERRRQQKQSTEEKALELLEKALMMDKQLAEKKQQQDKKVQERLEEMKKKKEDGRETRTGISQDTRF